MSMFPSPSQGKRVDLEGPTSLSKVMKERAGVTLELVSKV